MKKLLYIILPVFIILSMCACGKPKPNIVVQTSIGTVEKTSSDTVKKAETEKVEEDRTECSALGYTVKFVAAHKTKDDNGDPMVAIEMTFQNDNSTPCSFMGAAQVQLFQNGVSMESDEMFLTSEYDWDSYYTECKDGGSIPVFCAKPIKTDDPIEVIITIYDYNTWKEADSISVKTELTE